MLMATAYASTPPPKTQGNQSQTNSSPAYEILFNGDANDISIKDITPDAPEIPDPFKPRDKIPRQSTVFSAGFYPKENALKNVENTLENEHKGSFTSGNGYKYSNGGNGMSTMPSSKRSAIESPTFENQRPVRRRSKSQGDLLTKHSQLLRNLPSQERQQSASHMVTSNTMTRNGVPTNIYQQTMIPYPPVNPTILEQETDDIPHDNNDVDDIYYSSRIPFPASISTLTNEYPENKLQSQFDQRGQKSQTSLTSSKIPVKRPSLSGRPSHNRRGSSAGQKMLNMETKSANQLGRPTTTKSQNMGRTNRSISATYKRKSMSNVQQSSSTPSMKSTPMSSSKPPPFLTPSVTRVVNYDEVLIPTVAKRLQKEALKNQTLSAYDFVIQDWDRDILPDPGEAGFEAWKARQEELDRAKRRQAERQDNSDNYQNHDRNHENNVNLNRRLNENNNQDSNNMRQRKPRDHGHLNPNSPGLPVRDERYKAYEESYSNSRIPSPAIELRDRNKNLDRQINDNYSNASNKANSPILDEDEVKGGCCRCTIM